MRKARGAGRRPSDWRAILAGHRPEAVLERLVPGDPLDLRGCVARGLERRALALDAERVWLRVAARVAHRASGYRGRPALRRWLDLRVDEVILELVREDAGLAATAPDEAGCCAVAGPLGFAPAEARALLSTFNLCDEADRRAFLELVVRCADFDTLGRGAVRAARRARATWIALLDQAAAGRASDGASGAA